MKSESLFQQISFNKMQKFMFSKHNFTNDDISRLYGLYNSGSISFFSRRPEN